MTTQTDNFNRAGPALGADWTATQNTLTIASSIQAIGGSAGDNAEFWATATYSFAADHDSQVTIISVTAFSAYVGAIVRATAGGNYYVAYTDGSSGTGHTQISKYSGGVESVLTSVATTYAANDTLKLAASGTGTVTLTLYKNGSSVGSTTDSTSPFNSGQPGIYVFTTSGALDDWVGTDAVSAAITEESEQYLAPSFPQPPIVSVW